MKTVNKVGQAEKEHIPTFWSYGLKVMIMDCLSMDLGSISSKIVLFFKGCYTVDSSGPD